MRILTYVKDYGFHEVLEKGLIPVLSDQKLESSAVALATKGFHSVCDWHSVQRASLRASDITIDIFDAGADEKRKVFQILDHADGIKFFNIILGN